MRFWVVSSVLNLHLKFVINVYTNLLYGGKDYTIHIDLYIYMSICIFTSTVYTYIHLYIYTHIRSVDHSGENNYLMLWIFVVHWSFITFLPTGRLSGFLSISISHQLYHHYHKWEVIGKRNVKLQKLKKVDYFYWLEYPITVVCRYYVSK